jgi:ubiquinone/menaquinone biosynthesis C-methylase UbiE
MLPRTLEPEAMAGQEEASVYNTMDHAAVNAAFVADLLAAAQVPTLQGRPWFVLDAGTGTGHIPIKLCEQRDDARILAVDLSEAMLNLARANVEQAGLSSRIQIESADCKALPLANGAADAVMSNSLIHHIPDPLPAFAEFWRIVRPGGLLFVRDLARPDSESDVEAIVDHVAADGTAYERQLLRQSLHAALTAAEADNLARSIGLPSGSIQMTSDRHWTLLALKPVL